MVYAQYATAVGEELSATITRDDARRLTATAARDAAADHFSELCGAPAPPVDAFADALTDALYELRYHDAIDAVLDARVRDLCDLLAAEQTARWLKAGEASSFTLDLRF